MVNQIDKLILVTGMVVIALHEEKDEARKAKEKKKYGLGRLATVVVHVIHITAKHVNTTSVFMNVIISLFKSNNLWITFIEANK